MGNDIKCIIRKRINENNFKDKNGNVLNNIDIEYKIIEKDVSNNGYHFVTGKVQIDIDIRKYQINCPKPPKHDVMAITIMLSDKYRNDKKEWERLKNFIFDNFNNDFILQVNEEYMDIVIGRSSDRMLTNENYNQEYDKCQKAGDKLWENFRELLEKYLNGED